MEKIKNAWNWLLDEIKDWESFYNGDEKKELLENIDTLRPIILSYSKIQERIDFNKSLLKDNDDEKVCHDLRIEIIALEFALMLMEDKVGDDYVI